ncbi:hypothetical protein SAY87_020690 [Trapa incisa]|uniref:non-specific serine/threonine protein kinase n=1 Tax=Trapa incisa TaxID=236973 RepID=A0AAN7PN03_9MYRT|nr:hypothetical protein SAY87_020690 [Trapa incisa]
MSARWEPEVKLIIALAVLVFSLAFAAAAILKTKSFNRKCNRGAWKMTTFQKLDFGVLDVLDCLKDGNGIGRVDAGIGGTQGTRLPWKLPRAFCYLHHDCWPLIVKSNNVLLNSSFEAHVADFGLAKFLTGGGGGSDCLHVGSYRVGLHCSP